MNLTPLAGALALALVVLALPAAAGDDKTAQPTHDQMLEQQSVSDWMDTMGTGIMRDTGTWDAATRTISSTGTSKDPMGTTWTTRSTTRLESADRMVFTMYGKNEDVSEMKMMEIVYARAK